MAHNFRNIMVINLS